MYHCLNIINKKMCGNGIPEEEEAQKLFINTGMCPACYEAAMEGMYEGTRIEKAAETVVAVLGDLLTAVRGVEEAINNLKVREI